MTMVYRSSRREINSGDIERHSCTFQTQPVVASLSLGFWRHKYRDTLGYDGIPFGTLVTPVSDETATSHFSVEGSILYSNDTLTL